MTKNWEDNLKKFENFLKRIDIEKYAYLRQIKTVEQDLPRELLPLEIFYRYYWDTADFKDYDEIFKIYWLEKLNPYIYEFITKYFYGCSLQFVEEGFKARLYRIWMSILTQFHFQYLWNSLFEENLISSAELDMTGIDAIVKLNGVKLGIQIKKVSYRREASNRRFTKRQQTYADVIVEVPYLVLDIEDMKSKLKSPRVKEFTKAKYTNALNAFNKNFTRLSNGFVIFKEGYLNHIYQIITKKIKTSRKGDRITYREILTW